ncbi:universal stress protein [Streptomyces sp. ADMS]|uniref:universal stress protein n=1 Tax=Streptomyces sp. ADMS TaxID=3071415 RepID=UPI00296FD076|nr:universal stress protein [Streptomyces sp. ADMS]MDW4909224.1 universal stress protein [Streptomyces sp. ADMS]
MAARVVVGIDGSASSLVAVEAATREARWRDADLHLVHAFIWPVMHVPLGPSALGPPEGGLRNMADRLVAEAEEHARKVAPDVRVTSAVVTGEPLTVLQAQSRTAQLVVIGSRHMGGFIGLMVGSTAVHLTAHGHCPTLVMQAPGDATGPIVLGVDGSPAGARAIEFAFAEAALRQADVLALHTWTPWNAQMPAPIDPAMPYAGTPGSLAEREACLLSEALAGHQDRYPGVHVERQVVRQGTREALIEASRTAQLLVVGARGRGGFAGLLLGSVSQAMLNHAHCPVAVVSGASTAR